MTPFIGQIQLFGFNFAARGWAFCDGQLLPISQFTALFSLLGTSYGGDGRTTFALPDLRGRVAVHTGSGPGLSPINQGQRFGIEQTNLQVGNLPPHTHTGTLKLGAGPGVAPEGNGAFLATNAAGESIFTTVAPTGDQLAGNSVAIAETGNGQPIGIRNPYLGVPYSIALEGLYPSRS